MRRIKVRKSSIDTAGLPVLVSARSVTVTYLRIKAVLEGYYVGMRVLDELPHNLQLPILKSLVLQDLFDRYNLSSLHHLGLKDHAKRSISNDALS
jgi:hypothetical protein